MEALSQPFEGNDYHSHPRFPGRLLVVGESAYLKPEDIQSEFTKKLLHDVAEGGRASGGRVNYFRKLFFVLTGKRSREVDDAEWQSVWNSLAFYHFAQTKRLTTARIRPSPDEWEKSKAALMGILARLQPNFALLTGNQLNAYVRTIDGVIPCDEKIIRLPAAGEFTLTTYICHPSSSWFKSAEARNEFERLLAVK